MLMFCATRPRLPGRGRQSCVCPLRFRRFRNLLGWLCVAIPAAHAASAEDYTLRLTAVRSIDGSNSGVASQAGAAGAVLLRQSPSAYPGDGSGDEIIVPPVRPNPRTVSNVVCAQGGTVFSRDWLSDYVWAWGQFLDHDLDLTLTNAANGTAPVEIESSADLLAPGPIPFTRSNFIPHPQTGGREQTNELTAFIDGSQVYGSSADVAGSLRLMERGRLKTSGQDLLPVDDDGAFFAGDIRVNENVVLSALHTLFVREHNRIAALIALYQPAADDEQIYQLARKIVGAELQLITYQEFLPALLGPAAPRLREGSAAPTVDAGVKTEFSTAFFRVGHTLLSSRLQLAHQGRIQGSIGLRDAFFRPTFLSSDPFNLDRLLGGLQLQRAQEVDVLVIDDVRNFLFGAPGAGGTDLASLNIQRGRDHGLPDYNTLRAAYGMPRLHSFAAITFDTAIQQRLEAAYGHVDRIDPWIGGLAENHVPEAAVGPLILLALRDQFRRALAGDRFNVVADPDLQQPLVKAVISLDNLRLSDVVRMNTDYVAVNDDVFHAVPPAVSDVVARYDAASNRIFIHGNRLANRVVLWQLPGQVLAVYGQGQTRINGRQLVFLTTRVRPHLTLDLGGGNDVVTLLMCDLADVGVSLGAGRNAVSAFFSRAARVFHSGTEGTDVLYPPGGFLAGSAP